MRRGPEELYIRNLDRPSDAESRLRGMRAEKVVEDFLKRNYPLKVRMATPEEDKGYAKIIGTRGSIDEIVSDKNDNVVMVLQVSTRSDKDKIAQVYEEMRYQPFLRSPGTKDPKAPTIPRVFIKIEPGEADAYGKNPGLVEDPNFVRQLSERFVRSLEVTRAFTQNPVEKQRVQQIIDGYFKPPPDFTKSQRASL